MTEKIRWGVLGSGGIARRRTIPEGIVAANNALLAATYGVNEAVNGEVAAQFDAKAAASVDELLESAVDAIYIATPANLHHEQVLRCAKAGKSVLCEKPLGMTVAQARDMIDTCRNAGVQLGTAFMMRYQSQHRAALRLIQEGGLGQATYARAQLSCWYPPIPGAWRQDPATGGGGSLIDMGGHCIDLLEMFFGAVRRVSCFTNQTVHNYRSEDSAVAMLFFENGALGTVDTFFCIPDNSSKNSLELYGTKGSILARGTIGQGAAGEMVTYCESSPSSYDARQSRSDGAGVALTPEPINTYRAEIEEFSQALLDGRSTDASGQAGLRSQIVLSACYESARTGRVIELR